MNKLTVLLVFVMSLCCLKVFPQSDKIEIEDIKNSVEYYWGECPVKDSYEEVIETSLNELYSNIANNCKPSAIYQSGEDQKGQLLNIVKTFDNKIKENMWQKPIVEDPDNELYSYLVYIKRSDFEAMCNERKTNIERFANRGYKSENNDYPQLEDALRSYYWGMMLCLAHPYSNNMKISVDDEMVNAYEWFIDRIEGPDGVLKSFTFIVPKDNALQETPEGWLINLNVRSTYGVPVSNLKFQYYNGQRTVPASVNDGKATLLVKDIEKDKINIRIECEFKHESNIYPEVEKVLNDIKNTIKFQSSKHVVDLSCLKAGEEQKIEKIDEVEPESYVPMMTESVHAFEIAEKTETEWKKIDSVFNVDDTDYLSIMRDVEKALRENDYQSVRHYFTNEGFGMLDTLSRYGKMMVVGEQDYNFIKIDDQVICRDINMHFAFKNHASFNRDVVFRFDYNTNKICSIAFRLSEVTENDIISKSRWSKEARLVLVSFLEDYQTAYALKRRDYLQGIYSDDALIIVGHIVEKTVIPDRAQFNLAENEVSLMKYDKDTYFKNLSRTFTVQDYINIHFAETDFTRAPGNREIYGVRLLQEYYSSTYCDIGYLFLLVDLTKDKPTIHVRAWQPDKVDLDKLMGMKDLRL